MSEPVSPLLPGPGRSSFASNVNFEEVVSDFVRQVSESSGFSRQVSPASPGYAPSNSSDVQYANKDQTLIFFDWDDTLFPSTEFFNRMQVRREGFEDENTLDPTFLVCLQAWREALCMYLQEAARLCTQIVIVTNSKRPWVQTCIDNFVPQVKDVMNDEGIKVVYAGERLAETRRWHAQCRDIRPVKYRTESMSMTQEEHDDEQTLAKYQAMKQEAMSFYSEYPGQSWKNILSLGDMPYERDAAREVCFTRNSPRKEKLRAKTIVLPTAPSITEITLRLRFSRLMLPAYVHFDGDFDIDLSCGDDPLRTIAEALDMPQLAAVPFTRHAWGRVPLHEKDIEMVPDSLADVAYTVHDAMFT